MMACNIIKLLGDGYKCTTHNTRWDADDVPPESCGGPEIANAEANTIAAIAEAQEVMRDAFAANPQALVAYVRSLGLDPEPYQIKLLEMVQKQLEDKKHGRTKRR